MPVELGFLVTAGPALGVTVVGERVYVAAGNMGLRIIDERGSGPEIRARLEKQREQAGINYISIQGDDEAVLEQFAKEVVQPLAG